MPSDDELHVGVAAHLADARELRVAERAAGSEPQHDRGRRLCAIAQEDARRFHREVDAGALHGVDRFDAVEHRDESADPETGALPDGARSGVGLTPGGNRSRWNSSWLPSATIP